MYQCVPSKGEILVLKTQDSRYPRWGSLVQDTYILTLALEKKNQKKLITSSDIYQIVFSQMLLQQVHQTIMFCNYTMSPQNIPI